MEYDMTSIRSMTRVNGAGGDPDGDGKTNLEEYQDGTNPQAPPSPWDINRDGQTDAVDVQLVINGASGPPRPEVLMLMSTVRAKSMLWTSS